MTQIQTHISKVLNYPSLLQQVKQRVVLAQQKAIYAANEELLRMYWDLGRMLSNAQQAEGWGKGTLVKLSQDMKNEYPEQKGFSVRNLQCMMQFYEEYDESLTMARTIAQPPVAQLQAQEGIVQPTVAQLPEYNFVLPVRHIHWTHNVILMQRVKDIKARYWYMMQCLTSHWSKDFLAEAIKLDYYGQHGALANNFDATLSTPDAKGVKRMLKDPYIFDMLTFTEEYDERDVEIGLVKHVQQFLLEMGAGFAFMGRQYHLSISGDDYYIDLLMYNTFMHRYLVIELKNTEFRPEYLGKLNFYCSAVDDVLCREGDNKTIGLLLCKTKDRIKAEYALRDINKPIGISDYELGQALPKDLRSSLPSIEDIETELDSGNSSVTIQDTPTP
jgi:predicted nuclease of restriction endonuclease-like (RecB) superfamily